MSTEQNAAGAVEAEERAEDDDEAVGAAIEERAVAAEHKVEEGAAEAHASAAVPAANLAAGREGRGETEEKMKEGVEGGAGGEAEREQEGEGGESRQVSENSFFSSSCSSSSMSGSEGQYPAWRLALRRLIDSKTFKHSVTALILLNTLVLAMDHHPMDNGFSAALEACNFAFTLCFALEMVVKVGQS